MLVAVVMVLVVVVAGGVRACQDGLEHFFHGASRGFPQHWSLIFWYTKHISSHCEGYQNDFFIPFLSFFWGCSAWKKMIFRAARTSYSIFVHLPVRDNFSFFMIFTSFSFSVVLFLRMKIFFFLQISSSYYFSTIFHLQIISSSFFLTSKKRILHLDHLLCCTSTALCADCQFQWEILLLLFWPNCASFFLWTIFFFVGKLLKSAGVNQQCKGHILAKNLPILNFHFDYLNPSLRHSRGGEKYLLCSCRGGEANNYFLFPAQDPNNI